MFKIFNIKNRLVRHILFWIVYILAGAFTDLSKFEDYEFIELIVYHLNNVFFGALLSYLLIYKILKPEFIQKGYLIFGFTLLGLVYLLSALCRLSMVHIAEPLVRKPPFEQETPYEIFTDLSALAFKYGPTILTVTFVFYIVKFFSDTTAENQKKMQLSKEKAEAELKLLRAQLNPHFLFNTLNNIYSLSVINSPQTPNAISKLSEILDYALYKANTQLVPITNEVEAIENYIALEKLRYDDRLKVNITKEISHPNLVPPLLLLSLVENAFKHGAGEDFESPSITITIQTNAVSTLVEIQNTVKDFQPQSAKESIGLQNINKQLGLLFPNKYSFQTSFENKIFSVHLELRN